MTVIAPTALATIAIVSVFIIDALLADRSGKHETVCLNSSKLSEEIIIFHYEKQAIK